LPEHMHTHAHTNTCTDARAWFKYTFRYWKSHSHGTFFLTLRLYNNSFLDLNNMRHLVSIHKSQSKKKKKINKNTIKRKTNWNECIQHDVMCRRKVVIRSNGLSACNAYRIIAHSTHLRCLYRLKVCFRD